MKNRLFRKWTLFLVFTLCATLLFIIIPYNYYHHKKVHISIDDVWECFNDISKDSISYNSVFDHPFFQVLKKAHDITGAKFTLYVYESTKDYCIDDVPQKYITQINKEQDWLRVGFHASNDTIDRGSIDDLSKFTESFVRVNEKFVGAKTLRLQFFYATPDEVAFLGENDISTLLSADDDRISYSLPVPANDTLIMLESLLYGNMHYERTDIRIENAEGPFKALFRNRNDELLVLFTHEWALRNRRTLYEMWLYLLFFYIYNSDFIIN